jgi:hypothetical protein
MVVISLGSLEILGACTYVIGVRLSAQTTVLADESSSRATFIRGLYCQKPSRIARILHKTPRTERCIHSHGRHNREGVTLIRPIGSVWCGPRLSPEK